MIPEPPLITLGAILILATQAVGLILALIQVYKLTRQTEKLDGRLTELLNAMDAISRGKIELAHRDGIAEGAAREKAKPTN